MVDNPETAKTVLNNEKLTDEEEIVQITIQYRPGEIARLASRPGKANININYADSGLEPSTHAALASSGSRMAARPPQFSSGPQRPTRSVRGAGPIPPGPELFC